MVGSFARPFLAILVPFSRCGSLLSWLLPGGHPFQLLQLQAFQCCLCIALCLCRKSLTWSPAHNLQ
jgi:hypothetical protein